MRILSMILGDASKDKIELGDIINTKIAYSLLSKKGLLGTRLEIIIRICLNFIQK